MAKLHVIYTGIIQLCLDLSGYLDLTLLTVLVRHAIPPTNTSVFPAVASDRVNTNILEHKVPASLWYDFECA